MPADSETSEISPMYGNIQRVITTAASNSFKPEASTQTTTGAAITPTMQVNRRIQNSTVETASINERVREIAVALARGRQNRHECERERALAEQAPQHVGNAERRDISIVPRAGAEHLRDQDLADQPGDARGERQQRDGRRGAEQVHGQGEALARLQ